MLAIGFTDFTVRVYDIKYNRCIYILKGYTNRVTNNSAQMVNYWHLDLVTGQ